MSSLPKHESEPISIESVQNEFPEIYVDPQIEAGVFHCKKSIKKSGHVAFLEIVGYVPADKDIKIIIEGKTPKELFGGTIRESHKNNMDEKEHIDSTTRKAGGAFMSKLFTGLPLLQFEDISKAWSDFIEFHTIKLCFVLLGAIFTLLIGDFTILHWGLLVFTVIHFILRNMANKYKEQSEYLKIQRSIQLFLWPYVLLVIGNTLNMFVSLNMLPEDTLIALLISWLVWGELKGVIENAKICKFPVPSILERIITREKDGIDPPL